MSTGRSEGLSLNSHDSRFYVGRILPGQGLSRRRFNPVWFREDQIYNEVCYFFIIGKEYDFIAKKEHTHSTELRKINIIK